MPAVQSTLPELFRFDDALTVDTFMLNTFVLNLFATSFFKPGKTFNTEFNKDNVGQILIRNIGKIPTRRSVATAAGGLKIGTATETKDKILSYTKDNVVSLKETFPIAVDKFRNSSQQGMYVSQAAKSFAEGVQQRMMELALATPAAAIDTKIGGFLTAAASGTTITTYEAFLDAITSDLEQIRVNGGEADVLAISPQILTLLRRASGKFANAYLPSTNEELFKTGIVGKLFGVPVYETNLIGTGTPSTTATEIGLANAPSGKAAKCQYMVYDHKTLAFGMTAQGPIAEKENGEFYTIITAQGLLGGGAVNPALGLANYAA